MAPVSVLRRFNQLYIFICPLIYEIESLRTCQTPFLLQSSWLTGLSRSSRTWTRRPELWNTSSAKSQTRSTTEYASYRLSSACERCANTQTHRQTIYKYVQTFAKFTSCWFTNAKFHVTSKCWCAECSTGISYDLNKANKPHYVYYKSNVDCEDWIYLLTGVAICCPTET